jgi:hypothetical protein
MIMNLRASMPSLPSGLSAKSLTTYIGGTEDFQEKLLKKAGKCMVRFPAVFLTGALCFIRNSKQSSSRLRDRHDENSSGSCSDARMAVTQ